MERPFRGDPLTRGPLDRLLRLAELAHPLEVGRVLGPTRCVVEGELADLAVDPGPVESDRTWCSPERCDHGPDRGVVELDPRDLPDDRLLPRLVALPRLLAPEPRAVEGIGRLRLDWRACSVQRLPARLVTTPQTVHSFTRRSSTGVLARSIRLRCYAYATMSGRCGPRLVANATRRR